MAVPETTDFLNTDLSQDTSAELNKAEKWTLCFADMSMEMLDTKACTSSDRSLFPEIYALNVLNQIHLDFTVMY